MNKILTHILSSVAMVAPLSAMAEDGVYQVPNGNFDMDWVSPTEPGNGFHSFDLAIGSYKSQVNGHTADQVKKVEGRNGTSACMISSIQFKALNIITVKANGNLTSGVVTANGMSATAKENHNESQIKADNQHLKFAGLPDSISFYTKYQRGESGTYNANANFIIHGPVNYVDTYQADYDKSNKTNWVSEYLTSENSVSIPASEDWVRNVAAVAYKTPTAEYTDRYMLISFTTNPKPGATMNDHLTIDDVEFIYNSRLASVKLGGVAVDGFDKNIYSYTVDVPYDEFMSVECTTDAKAATVKKNFDSSSNTLTIVVEGNDISVNPANRHEYVFQLKAGVEIMKSVEYTDNIISNIGGNITNTEDKVVKIDYYSDNTCGIVLKDLKIGDVNVGNVSIKADYTVDADSIRFSGESNVVLGGSYAVMGAVPVKISGTSALDYGKMQALMNIKVSAAIEVDLQYGYEYVAPVVLVKSYSGSACAIKNGVRLDEEMEASVEIFSNNTSNVSLDGNVCLGYDLTTEDNDTYIIFADNNPNIKVRYVASASTIYFESLTDTIEYGTCIIPRIEKTAVYNDYVEVNCGTGYIRPYKTSVKVDFYNTGVANIAFAVSENDTLVYNDVPYTKGDSLFMVKEGAVNGASTLTYFKLVAEFSNGDCTYSFGTYNDENHRRTVIDTKEFTDNLLITVNGEDLPVSKQLVRVDFYDDETVNFSIKDFTLDGQLLGDVVMDSLKYTISGDSIHVSGSQLTSFVSEDPEAVGMYFPEMNIELDDAAVSTNYDKMTANLTIDLTKTTLKQMVGVKFGYRYLVKSAKYTDSFALTVNGEESEATKETITVDYYDNGEAKLSILNFSIGGELVGDIVLDGVSYTVGEDSIRISGSKSTVITSSNPDAMGPSLGEIPIVIRSSASSLDYKKLTAVIDIDMQELLNESIVLKFGYYVAPKVQLLKTASYSDTLIVSVNGEATDPQVQSVSVDFYDNSFATLSIMNFSFGGALVGDIVLDSVAYSLDGDSIKLSGSRNISITSETPGALGTGLGTVPVKIVSAASSKTYDKLVMNLQIDMTSSLSQMVDVTFGIVPVKPVIPEEVVLVKEGDYKDNMNVYKDGILEDGYTANVKIQYFSNNYATILFPDFSCSGQLIGDIKLDSIPYKTSSDSVLIRGARLINITSANPNAVGPDFGKVKVSVSGAANETMTEFFGKLTLDLQSLLQQTIEGVFGEPAIVPVEPEDKSVAYTDLLQVSVNGDATAPQKQQINVEYKADGTCSLSIPNFTLVSDGEEILVGDVVLEGVPYTVGNDSIRISGSKTIAITSSDPDAIGPDLGKVPVSISSASSTLDYKQLKLVLDIDMQKSLGQIINVTFGYAKQQGGNKFTPGTAVYSDSLVVSVDGNSSPAQMTDIIIDYAADGTCTLSIKNFVMGSGDEAIEVGDIVVPGVTYTVGADSVRLSGSKRIVIDSEMGAMLGEIPVTLTQVSSSLDKRKLTANIDIDMSESIGQIVNVQFGYTSLNTTPVIVFTPGTAVYSDSLVVSVDGNSSPAQMTDIIVDYAADGTCTLSIKNFVMGSGDEAIEVGDIVVPGVTYTVGADSVRLSGSKRIIIDSEMGAMLGEIPVTLTQVSSSLDKRKLTAIIDIDMRESIGQIVGVQFGFTDLNTGGDIPSTPVVVDSVTFTDSIFIYANESSCSSSLGQISVVFYSNNTADITIHDLSTVDEFGTTLLGDALVKGVKFSQVGDSLVFSKTVASIKFTSDNDEAVGSYMGTVNCQFTSGTANMSKTKFTAKYDFWLPNSNVSVSFGYENPTGLDMIVSEVENDGNVYSVSGMFIGKNVDMNSLPNGLYIRNGRKFLIRK